MGRVRTRLLVRRAAAASAALVLCALPVTPAFADGPGYGGDAGQLSVTWTRDDVPQDVPVDVPQDVPVDVPQDVPVDVPQDVPVDVPQDVPVDVPQALGGSARGVGAIVRLPVTTDPQIQNDALALLVRGLGFRGKSAVEVRIGSQAAVITRADSAGALAVALDPAQIGQAQPGLSVMAVGRNQSGTEVTLFGSVPPVADGSGPMSLVPWAAGAIALTGLALWTRRRHHRHAP